MDLTTDQKFEAGRLFWSDGFVSGIKRRLVAFGIKSSPEDVLHQVYDNSYRLMEEIKRDIGDECDPFYEDFPFLMYGTSGSMYYEDQLFLLKQRTAKEHSDPSVLYLPNDAFKTRYVRGDEPELKRGLAFSWECAAKNITLFGAYCKDSNSIWLDGTSLVLEAILGVLVSRHSPADYSPERNGSWEPLFEGLCDEFGHFLYRKDFESIGPGEFVNHPNSKAHRLGARYSRAKSNDPEYVNNFFSLLLAGN